MEKPQPWLIHSLHPGAVRGGSPSPTPQQLLPRSPPGSVIRRRPCAPSHAAEVPRSSMCRLTWSASTPHTRDGHVRVPGQRGRTNWEMGGWGHPGWAEGTCLLARVQRDTACCSRSFQLEVQPGRRGTHTSRSTGREGAGPLLLSNGVPGPEGSSVRDLGLGRHQQPRGGTELAGALQGLGGLPWPWLRLAEVSQLWPSWWLGMEAEGGSQDWGSPSEQK